MQYLRVFAKTTNWRIQIFLKNSISMQDKSILYFTNILEVLQVSNEINIHAALLSNELLMMSQEAFTHRLALNELYSTPALKIHLEVVNSKGSWWTRL